MDSSVEIRTATSDDRQAYADLAMMASDHLCPLFFGARSHEFLEAMFGKRGNLCDYDKARYAIVDGRIAALLSVYDWRQQKKEGIYTYWLYVSHLKISIMQGAWTYLGMPKWFGMAARGQLYIACLATYPEFRKRGLGSVLLACAEETARNSGCSALSLDADAANTTALSVYYRFGFKLERQARCAGRASILGSLVRLVKKLA